MKLAPTSQGWLRYQVLACCSDHRPGAAAGPCASATTFTIARISVSNALTVLMSLSVWKFEQGRTGRDVNCRAISSRTAAPGRAAIGSVSTDTECGGRSTVNAGTAANRRRRGSRTASGVRKLLAASSESPVTVCRVALATDVRRGDRDRRLQRSIAAGVDRLDEQLAAVRGSARDDVEHRDAACPRSSCRRSGDDDPRREPIASERARCTAG